MSKKELIRKIEEVEDLLDELKATLRQQEKLHPIPDGIRIDPRGNPSDSSGNHSLVYGHGSNTWTVRCPRMLSYLTDYCMEEVRYQFLKPGDTIVVGSTGVLRAGLYLGAKMWAFFTTNGGVTISCLPVSTKMYKIVPEGNK